MNIEERYREISRKEKEKRRLRRKNKKQTLFRWKKHDQDDCVCDDTPELLEQFPVSLLQQQSDFDTDTNAEILWACKRCGRVPPTETVKKLGPENHW